MTTKYDHSLCGTKSDSLEAPTSDGVKSDMGNTGESARRDNSAVSIDFAHFAHTDLNATHGCVGKSTNGIRSSTIHSFRMVEN